MRSRRIALLIERLASGLLLGATLAVVGCSDDSEDGPTSAGTAAGGGSDGVGGSTGSGAAGGGGQTSGPSTGGSGGGGSCKTAGEACGPSDYCNAWTCHCLNSTTDFNTVGSCENGVCSTGEEACASICAPNGGVMEAIDGGCF